MSLMTSFCTSYNLLYFIHQEKHKEHENNWLKIEELHFVHYVNY